MYFKSFLLGQLSLVGILSLTYGTVSGSRILVYPFGHCLNSHLLNAERLSQILSEAGHKVEMLVSSAYSGFDHRSLSATVHPSGHPSGHFKLIHFDGPENHISVCDHDSLDFMLYASLKDRFAALFETMVSYCDRIFSNDSLIKLLKMSSYDLVIVEALDPCGRILVDYLDVPFVILVSAGLGHFDSNPRPPSYLPAATAPFTTHMTFGQRVANTIMKVMYDKIIPALLGTLQPFEILKQKYGLNASLSLANSFDRTALRLVNSDFAIDYPAPIEPDTVLVGGFAVERPFLLPLDLEDFVNGSADHGVIVMNFGTVVKSFSDRWTSFFAAVFRRLPQRVIWRHSNTNLTLSPNVKLVKWMPQTSLLAHPKTRLFISHCGLNSVFEAASFGIPVLALPLSGDQFNQAVKVSDHLEMGVMVDAYSMTRKSLYDAIQTVLADPKFARNAREVAKRVADQPLSAAEKIRFWIDYVIRHHGAPHLRSDASRLPWYQYLCLDVAACLTVIILMLVLVFLVCLYVTVSLGRRIVVLFMNNCSLLFAKFKLD